MNKAFVPTTVQKKALELLRSEAKHILLFGGSRSGKTTVLVMAVIYRACRYAGSRHLICRYRGEDAFIDLGKLFVEDFTDAYAHEFDVQCLTANATPFTGALYAGKNVHTVADVNKLSYLDLREAEQKVPAEERQNCKWFFSETVTTHLMNVTDANGYPIWRKPGDEKSARIDGYEYHEVSCLPQLNDIKADTPFAVFMDPKKIIHGNRKGIEIRKFDQTSESLEYGEEFFRFRKRDGFLCTLTDCSVILKTK